MTQGSLVDSVSDGKVIQGMRGVRQIYLMLSQSRKGRPNIWVQFH